MDLGTGQSRFILGAYGPFVLTEMLETALGPGFAAGVFPRVSGLGVCESAISLAVAELVFEKCGSMSHDSSLIGRVSILDHDEQQYLTYSTLYGVQYKVLGNLLLALDCVHSLFVFGPGLFNPPGVVETRLEYQERVHESYRQSFEKAMASSHLRNQPQRLRSVAAATS